MPDVRRILILGGFGGRSLLRSDPVPRTALERTPNDLIEVDTAPVAQVAKPAPKRAEMKVSNRAFLATALTNYRQCLDCSAPVKFKERNRCHTCHQRARLEALNRRCVECGAIRNLRHDDRCAGCIRASTPPKTPRRVSCRVCGEQRRNVGHGLCSRCRLTDPDRPFQYAEIMAAKLGSPPTR